MKVGVFTVLFADQSSRTLIREVPRLRDGRDRHRTSQAAALSRRRAARERHRRGELQGEDRGCWPGDQRLSCHGNALHPNESIAQASRDAWRKTLRLAEKLGVLESSTSRAAPAVRWWHRSHLVTAPWPDDFQKTLDWQWNEKVIPTGKRRSAKRRSRGQPDRLRDAPQLRRLQPETLAEAAAGDAIGANFDPSHLFWQMIDPIAAVRALTCIWHVHAKDTKICLQRAHQRHPGHQALHG